MSIVSKRKVLVLNRLWMACGVVTLRRAIALLCKEHAEVIDHTNHHQSFSWDEWEQLEVPDGEVGVHGARRAYRIPEVIVLLKFDRVPNQRINFSRRALHRRDGGTCMYCGDQPGHDQLTIDHVVPRSQGGITSWDNCVSACSGCNSRKANRTPEQAGMRFCVEGFKPFKPRYNLYKGDTFLPSWEHYLGKGFATGRLKE